jgi:hypothetical protein
MIPPSTPSCSSSAAKTTLLSKKPKLSYLKSMVAGGLNLDDDEAISASRFLDFFGQMMHFLKKHAPQHESRVEEDDFSFYFPSN